MKIVFMGTPEFAAVSLRALLDLPQAEILAVYCQPDRPAGRGGGVAAGPVKRLALDQGLPVRQPLNFKAAAERDALEALGADLFAVAAYGLILPQAVLDIPPLGGINVHASLLPELRGAAPIQRAVMAGALRTGITIMRMALQLDSGPILIQRALGIGFEQNAGEVHDELAALGGRLLAEAVERIEKGTIREIPQDESKATYAPKLEKAEGILDITLSARAVHNQARGVTPWPGAQLRLVCPRTENGAGGSAFSLLVQKGRALEGIAAQEEAARYQPGDILPVREGLLPVVCADGLYGMERLKPAGGRGMAAADFCNGYLRGGGWKAVNSQSS